ncbi:MAG: hypothetical protein ACRELY_07430 [Polyangiaceae bacterium]
MKIVDHRVPTYDFSRAMMLAGYRFMGSAAGHVRLAKDAIELVVPESDDLPEQVILALLEKANIPPLQFVVLLSRLASRYTLAEQQLPNASRSRK